MLTSKVPSTVSGEAFLATVKTSPPVVVTTGLLAGMTIDTWIKVATLAYIVIQASVLVFNTVRNARAKKNGG